MPPPHARRSRGASWRSSRRPRTPTPGHPQPDERARGGHPVVVVRVPRRRRVSGRGVMTSPSDVCSACPPSRVISVGQRGEPVGLVAAQVRDAAQPGRGVGQRGEGGDRRRELAGGVQVEVDAVDRAGAGHAQHVAVQPRGGAHALEDPGQQARRAAWCAVGQPGHAHGPAGDQRRARGTAPRWTGRARRARPAPAIGPGATCQISGPGVVDLDAGLPQHLRRSSRCAAGSAASGRCAAASARCSNRAAASSRPDTNWLDADASTSTWPPRDATRAVHRERQVPGLVVLLDRARPARAAPRAPDPSAGPGRRSSPSNRTGSVGERGDRRQEAHDGPGEAAVDARAAAHRPRRDHPVGAVLVDPRAQARAARRAMSSVSRDRSAPRRRPGPVRERGEHEVPVGQGLRSGHVDERVERARGAGAAQIVEHRRPIGGPPDAGVAGPGRAAGPDSAPPPSGSTSAGVREPGPGSVVMAPGQPPGPGDRCPRVSDQHGDVLGLLRGHRACRVADRGAGPRGGLGLGLPDPAADRRPWPRRARRPGRPSPPARPRPRRP